MNDFVRAGMERSKDEGDPTRTSQSGEKETMPDGLSSDEEGAEEEKKKNRGSCRSREERRKEVKKVNILSLSHFRSLLSFLSFSQTHPLFSSKYSVFLAGNQFNFSKR